jgi:hypothetical protein
MRAVARSNALRTLRFGSGFYAVESVRWHSPGLEEQALIGFTRRRFAVRALFFGDSSIPLASGLCLGLNYPIPLRRGHIFRNRPDCVLQSPRARQRQRGRARAARSARRASVASQVLAMIAMSGLTTQPLIQVHIDVFADFEANVDFAIRIWPTLILSVGPPPFPRF